MSICEEKNEVQSPNVISFNSSCVLPGVYKHRRLVHVKREICSREVYVEFSLVASIFCTPYSVNPPEQYRQG